MIKVMKLEKWCYNEQMGSLVNKTSAPEKNKSQKLNRFKKTTAPEIRKTLHGWFIYERGSLKALLSRSILS